MAKETAKAVSQAQAAPPAPQNGSTSVRVGVKRESWHGPLPAPENLAAFDQVLPGLAERIVRMAEEEGEHSRYVQRTAVNATVRLQYIGQAMAFALSSGALFVAYLLAMAGHDWVAGGLVATGFAGIASVFMNVARSRSKAE